MITKPQIVDESNREFHHVSRTQSGYPNPVCYRIRRNGRTQTWKTRPDEFKMPYKWGLYGHGYITHDNASEWVLASQCPRCNTKVGPIRISNMRIFLVDLGVTPAAVENYITATLQYDFVNIFVAGELTGILKLGYAGDELHAYLTLTFTSINDPEF